MVRALARATEPSRWWREEHWGTKWDAVDIELGAIEGGREDAVITIRYLTAWGPSTPWVQTASEMWPNLDFSLKYEEPGMCFRGGFHAQAGLILEDDQEQSVPDVDSEDVFGQSDPIVSFFYEGAKDNEDLPFRARAPRGR